MHYEDIRTKDILRKDNGETKTSHPFSFCGVILITLRFEATRNCNLLSAGNSDRMSIGQPISKTRQFLRIRNRARCYS